MLLDGNPVIPKFYVIPKIYIESTRSNLEDDLKFLENDLKESAFDDYQNDNSYDKDMIRADEETLAKYKKIDDMCSGKKFDIIDADLTANIEQDKSLVVRLQYYTLDNVIIAREGYTWTNKPEKINGALVYDESSKINVQLLFKTQPDTIITQCNGALRVQDLYGLNIR